MKKTRKTIKRSEVAPAVKPKRRTTSGSGSRRPAVSAEEAVSNVTSNQATQRRLATNTKVSDAEPIAAAAQPDSSRATQPPVAMPETGPMPIGDRTQEEPLPAGKRGSTTNPLTVSGIEIVDSSKGAATGFAAIEDGFADLNTPGPFNDPESGETRNVHQVHFHVDQGDSAELVPKRRVKATANYGGKIEEYPEAGSNPGGVRGSGLQNDGPLEREVLRPGTDEIVVADAPGAKYLKEGDYPFTLLADFNLTVSDAKGADVASVEYLVKIQKESLTDVPNSANKVRAVEKKDLVRGKKL